MVINEGQPLLLPGTDFPNITIHRFHSIKHSYEEQDLFPRSFLDTEHTIRSQYRFAGRCCNPGTFFSLSEETCVYEMLYYNPELGLPVDGVFDVQDVLAALAIPGRSRAFFSGVASFENILDLCNPGTLHNTLRWCFPAEPWDESRLHTADILLWLACKSPGGDALTDLIGKRAYEAGFNGVRFLSVRALSGMEGGYYEKGLNNTHWGDIFDPFEFFLSDMVERTSNLVIFRGTYLIKSIRKYSFERQGCKWRKVLREKLTALDPPKTFVGFPGVDLGLDLSPKIPWRKLATKFTMQENKYFGMAIEKIEDYCVRNGALTGDDMDSMRDALLYFGEGFWTYRKNRKSGEYIF